ncbi:MAG: type II secretion system protein [Planctomycetota bacterium]
MKSQLAPSRAFTLVELLVVISIIALLIGILMPILGNARSTSENAVCLSNLRQLFIATQLYANDNDDYLPTNDAFGGWGYRMRPGDTVPDSDPNASTFGTTPESLGLPEMLESGKYLFQAPEAWICPSNKKFEEYGQTYQWVFGKSLEDGARRLYDYSGQGISQLNYIWDNYLRTSPPPGTPFPVSWSEPTSVINPVLTGWNSAFTLPQAEWEPIHIRNTSNSSGVLGSTNAAYLDGHAGIYKFN